MVKKSLPPESIYRHRGYTDQDIEKAESRSRLESELHAAKEGRVWFSPLSNQNDPLDTLPVFVHSKRAEIKRLIKAFKAKYGSSTGYSGIDIRVRARKLGIPIRRARETFGNPDNFKTSFPRILEDSRKLQVICCFTDSPLNSLMWAYYSCSHQSFCYEFVCNKPDLDLAKRVVGQVKYLDARPRLTTVKAIRWLVNASQSENPPTAPELIVSDAEEKEVTDALVLSKSQDLRHEGEWRAIQPVGVSSGFHSIEPYRLNSIVFGVNASNRLKEFVSSSIGPEVQVKQLKLSEEEYGLEFSS